MSGGISAGSALAAMAAVTAVSTIMQQQSAAKALDQQKSAQNQARQQAEAQAKAADEATNRANQKSPDTMSILDAAQQAAKSGGSGTMITGAQGVDPNSLSLGKNTLLGA